jgi:hypothetical protein
MQAMKWTHCLLSLVGCLVLAVSARAGPIVPYDPLIVGFDFDGDGKGDIIRDAGAGGIRIDILDGTSSVAKRHPPDRRRLLRAQGRRALQCGRAGRHRRAG